MPTAENLSEKVRTAIARYAMIEPGGRVLAAVSGGADSVCLLHVLLDLGYALEVAHFDHQTREGVSAADAEFVREMAAGLDVPVHTASGPVAQEAHEARRSFEDYAREVRYNFFLATAAQNGCAVIATGHTADDQAETVLMRVIRGTSPLGLAGIAPVRARDGVRMVRPLIASTRADVLAYLTDRHMPWREDATNADTKYTRNRFRHQLLPALEADYNAGVRDALRRLAEMQRDDNDLLETLAGNAYAECVKSGRIDRTLFGDAPVAIQRRVLARVAWDLNLNLDFERIDAAAAFVARGPAGNACDLGAGISIVNGRNTAEIVREKEARDPAVITLNAPGTTHAFGRAYTVAFPVSKPAMPLAQYCSPSRQVFDADAVRWPLRVRHPVPGERFRPFGLDGSKTLGDYFTDIGLPVPQRATRPLIVDARDRILWVVGHAPSADAALTNDTTRVVEIGVTDEI